MSAVAVEELEPNSKEDFKRRINNVESWERLQALEAGVELYHPDDVELQTLLQDAKDVFPAGGNLFGEAGILGEEDPFLEEGSVEELQGQVAYLEEALKVQQKESLALKEALSRLTKTEVPLAQGKGFAYELLEDLALPNYPVELAKGTLLFPYKGALPLGQHNFDYLGPVLTEEPDGDIAGLHLWFRVSKDKLKARHG